MIKPRVKIAYANDAEICFDATIDIGTWSTLLLCANKNLLIGDRELSPVELLFLLRSVDFEAMFDGGDLETSRLLTSFKASLQDTVMGLARNGVSPAVCAKLVNPYLLVKGIEVTARNVAAFYDVMNSEFCYNKDDIANLIAEIERALEEYDERL